MFGMLGIFSEFEREMIVARVKAGIARAKEAIDRDGHFISKAEHLRKRLGRPGVNPKKLEPRGRQRPMSEGQISLASWAPQLRDHPAPVRRTRLLNFPIMNDTTIGFSPRQRRVARVEIRQTSLARRTLIVAA
jgi:hypothetical protein